MIQIGAIAVELGTNEFMLPYLQRALQTSPDMPLQAAASEQQEPLPIVAGLRIISDADSDASSMETSDFKAACAEIPVVVLKTSNIIGTGMTGFPREIAKRIYSGSYTHIKGNEARISVIHAAELARAAQLAIGSQGQYEIDDETNPLIEELANALAYRIDDKRLITLSPRLARLWLGKSFYAAITTDHLADNTFRAAFPDFHPANTIEYLRTHVYDENSL